MATLLATNAQLLVTMGRASVPARHDGQRRPPCHHVLALAGGKAP
jgi:hypothetical protein